MHWDLTDGDPAVTTRDRGLRGTPTQSGAEHCWLLKLLHLQIPSVVLSSRDHAHSGVRPWSFCLKLGVLMCPGSLRVAKRLFTIIDFSMCLLSSRPVRRQSWPQGRAGHCYAAVWSSGGVFSILLVEVCLRKTKSVTFRNRYQQWEAFSVQLKQSNWMDNCINFIARWLSKHGHWTTAALPTGSLLGMHHPHCTSEPWVEPFRASP